MFTTHGVLHRDVSYGNIMLLPSPKDGMLIDFDLAICANRSSVSAHHRTGTIEFMAVDLLVGADDVIHSPRHDIESFFYVLLLLAIRYSRASDGKMQARKEKYRDGIFLENEMMRLGEDAMLHFGILRMGLMDTQKRFCSMVLPTLDKDARDKLGQLFVEWRRLLFPPEELEDKQLTEQQLYAAVLKMLETAIERLQGA
jgi:serine/threonine protein kinase